MEALRSLCRRGAPSRVWGRSHHGRAPPEPTPRVSRLFRPSNLREGQDAGEAGCRSHRLLVRAGLVHASSPGCFCYLPTALRSLEKLVRLIDAEMRAVGGQKLDMPALCGAEPWRRSGRWDLMGSEMFRLRDRHHAEYCLGPTHEEVVTELLASHSTLSYKQLPLLLYQVTRKFRDEQRPRLGLLRAREFYMKDMYSFDVDEAAALHTYEAVRGAYARLFGRLGLRCVQVRAHAGHMGGTLSHEFHLPAGVGEDRLLVCAACGYSANAEADPAPHLDRCRECPRCRGGPLDESRGIEVGHAFYLGTRYSRAFGATYTSAQNAARPAEMACFGLGVTRILAAAIEVLSSDEGIRWPALLAPYQVCILPPKEGGAGGEGGARLAEGLARTLASALPRLDGEVVLDDRTGLTIGKRLRDARMLGYPYVVVVAGGARGGAGGGEFEVVCQGTGETLFLGEDALLELLGAVETV